VWVHLCSSSVPAIISGNIIPASPVIVIAFAFCLIFPQLFASCVVAFDSDPWCGELLFMYIV